MNKNLMKGETMFQKIKNHLMLTVASLIMAVVPFALPAAVSYADLVCGGGSIGQAVGAGAQGVTSGSSSGTGGCAGGSGVNNDTITKVGKNIVNLFSLVIGVVAVVMIIVGGFRYITSGGDSGRVGGAKNTLIYAIIGLVIVALAQIIVHFVLNQTNNAITS